METVKKSTWNATSVRYDVANDRRHDKYIIRAHRLLCGWTHQWVAPPVLARQRTGFPPTLHRSPANNSGQIQSAKCSLTEARMRRPPHRQVLSKEQTVESHIGSKFHGPESSNVPLRNRPECGLLCSAPCCPPNHRYRICLLSQPEKCDAELPLLRTLGLEHTTPPFPWSGIQTENALGPIHLAQLCAGSGRSEFQPNQDVRKTRRGTLE